MKRSLTTLSCALPLLAGPASAQLDLTLLSTTDISQLGMFGVGGASYDPTLGGLWLSDSCGPGCIVGGTNMVWQIDALTGFPFSGFDAGAVPGIDKGADALAYDPTTGLLFLCSAYGGDNDGGSVTTSGTLVKDWGTGLRTSAIAVSPAGELFAIPDPAMGGDGALHRINKATGAFETTIPLVGYGGRVSEMDFDPITGNLFAFAGLDPWLLEIDPATGVVMTVTDLSPFGIGGEGFDTAFAFRDDGEQLYLGRGAGLDAEVLYVFDREPPGCSVVFCGVNPDNTAALYVDSCDCSQDSLYLEVSGATPDEFGYPLVAAGTGVVTNPPGAQGDLCLVGNGPIGRYAMDVQKTGPAATARVDLRNALSGGGNGGIPTIGGNLCSPGGQTWNFQWWYRDGMNPSRFSRGVRVTFH